MDLMTSLDNRDLRKSNKDLSYKILLNSDAIIVVDKVTVNIIKNRYGGIGELDIEKSIDLILAFLMIKELKPLPKWFSDSFKIELKEEFYKTFKEVLKRHQIEEEF